MANWKDKFNIEYFRPRGAWIEVDRDKLGDWYVIADVVAVSLYSADGVRKLPRVDVPLHLSEAQKTVVLNVLKDRLIEVAANQDLTLLPMELEKQEL